jgi:hypothetical protein
MALKCSKCGVDAKLKDSTNYGISIDAHNPSVIALWVARVAGYPTKDVAVGVNGSY